MHTSRFISPARRRAARGFTLVEVMISLALVLLLVLGISQVFRMTSDTVSAGQAMSGVVRNTRAAQSVFYNDFRTADKGGGPALVISSSVTPAFRNRADELGDRDYVVGAGTPAQIRSYDFDGDGVDDPPAASAEFTYNLRNHRTDTLSFFARDLFRRQTGNDGVYASSMTSNEAWIWYGHLWRPDGAGTQPQTAATLPGAGNFSTNPNNFHAGNWLLGRVAMLLADPTIPAMSGQEYNEVRTTGGAGPVATSPFGFFTLTTDGRPAFQSRYDLGGTTIADWQNTVIGLAPAQSAPQDWWVPLVAAQTAGPLTAASVDHRFQAEPNFLKPLTSEKAARMSPVLFSGCTQFIVEYAGDFLQQDATTGAITGHFDTTGADGATDFVITSTGPGGAPVRTVRWYGMWRDVNGDVNNDGALIEVALDSPDVMPLQAFRTGVTPQAAPFERFLLGTPTAPEPRPRYVCVWGPPGSYTAVIPQPAEPPRPTMIRITYVLDDPNGRIGEGQWYECVLRLR